jgi:hypothetical protein
MVCTTEGVDEGVGEGDEKRLRENGEVEGGRVCGEVGWWVGRCIPESKVLCVHYPTKHRPKFSNPDHILRSIESSYSTVFVKGKLREAKPSIPLEILPQVTYPPLLQLGDSPTPTPFHTNPLPHLHTYQPCLPHLHT